jgi:hypothetical protein
VSVRFTALAAVSLVMAIVVAGCGPGSPAAPTVAGTPATATTPATPSGATPIASVFATPAPGSLPPDASLAAEGGDPIVGQLGSFTWADGGSDSPWLPGAPIGIGAGEPLRVTLADATPVGAWTAVRAPADSTTGAGAVAVGAGSGAIGFAIATPGRWTVAVTIGFVTGGSATWYWQVDVG